MKIRKFIIISLLSLMLLAGLVMVWWFLSGELWVKGKIEDSVSDITGRSFSINGAFSLDLSANTVLTAEDIRLSNPPWANSPDLARIDDFEISVNLLSVFSEPVKINYIAIDGLVIDLEESESGEKNWEILSGQEQAAPTADSPPKELPINVDTLTLVNFTLLHEAPNRTVPLDFHLKLLELTHRADQHIEIITDGRFGGEQFDITGNMGPLIELVRGGKTSHDIRLAVGDITLLSQGSIEHTAKLSGGNIKLDFSGPKFEWILTQLALPPFSHGGFDFKLDVKTDGDQTRLNLDGDLGSLQAYARGDFKDLGESGTEGGLTGDVSGDDLGSLLKLFGVAGVPRSPFNLKVDASYVSGLSQLRTVVLETAGNTLSVSGQIGDWPELADTDLAMSASGPDLQIWGEALHTDILPSVDFDLNGKLSSVGSQSIDTDTQLRLGDSTIKVSGLLGKLPSMNGADLIVTANGPVDGTLVQMLGVTDGPGKVFSLNAKLQRDASYTYLDEVRVEVADNHLDLSGQLGDWPELVGTNLVFSLAGPDLRAWSSILKVENLPQSKFSVSGEISPADKGLTLDNVSLVLGDHSLKLNGLMVLTEEMQGSHFQAHTVISDLASIGPILGVEGLPNESLSVYGDYQRIPEGWAFRLSDGNFAGANFESEGKYTVIDQRLQIEATSHLSAPNLARLGRIAGVENLPEQPIDVSGFIHYDAGEVDVRDLQGRVGDSQFNLSAKLVNSPSWSGSEVTLSASGPDFDQLVVSHDTEEMLPFSLEGNIVADDRGLRLNRVKSRLGLFQASVDGAIGRLEDMSATDVQFEISSPTLKNIGELLDYPLPDDPFSLEARFKGSPSEFHAEQMEIGLGSSDLSGQVSVDLTGKPKVHAVLVSNYLDLKWLKVEEKEDRSGKTSANESKPDYLIPDTPIDYPQMDFADIDIDISINKLDFLHLTTSDFHTNARLLSGNLFVDTFQLRGLDGDFLSGNMTVERDVDSDITKLVLGFNGQGVKLGIGAAEGQDPKTIRQSDIVANLSGSGVTYRDLASSLNGYVEIVQGAGLTENVGFSLVFGNVISETLNLLNPFAETEKYTKNECAVAIVNIESGVVTVDPYISQTDRMTFVADGEVDLSTEKLQFAFNTKLRKGTGLSASMVVNPFVSVTGTLASPIIGLDPAAVAVKGTVAVATLGISLLTKSLADRFLSSKDPCGDALKKSREKS